MRMHRTLCLLAGLALLAGCGREEKTDYADEMAEQHAHDTPAASPAVAEPTAPVVADTVQYGTEEGRPLTGYLAAPARPDSFAVAAGRPVGSPLPAVIVLHEWWGLNDNIRAMTRRLAGEGYRALAVDLYGGRVAETPDSAQALLQRSLARGTATAHNLTAAYRFLEARHGAPRIASLGWCFGGAMSLEAAFALPDALDATVVYYGALRGVTRERLATLQMPVLAFFGADDTSIPVDSVRAFEQALKDLGKEAEVHVYEGAGHAFANPSGQNYVEAAARDAWERTTAFLRQHLYAAGPSTL